MVMATRWGTWTTGQQNRLNISHLQAAVFQPVEYAGVVVVFFYHPCICLYLVNECPFNIPGSCPCSVSCNLGCTCSTNLVHQYVVWGSESVPPTTN
jgi:hypothetical protein